MGMHKTVHALKIKEEKTIVTFITLITPKGQTWLTKQIKG